MKKKKLIPRNNKDVFRTFLLKNAQFVGDWDMPFVPISDLLPEKLISFDKFDPIVIMISGYIFLLMIINLSVFGIDREFT